MPSFSFGEQSNICRDCRQQQQEKQQQPQIAELPRAGMLALWPVTTILIALNVIAYIACAIASYKSGRGSPMDFDSSMLVEWGADFGPLTLTGQYWRVITSMFLHGGLIHIGANMYCFWDFGRMAERMYGRARFASIYMITGIGSSIASLALHPLSVSVGASGAIFGVVGALVLPFYRRRAQLPPGMAKGMLRTLVTFILLNLFIGFAVPVIDNAAHVGGLLFGLILGAVWAELAHRQAINTSSVWKVTVVSVAVCAAAFVGVQNLHHDRILPMQAMFDLENGKPQQALDRAKEAVAKRPNDYMAHLALADVYYQRFDFANAAPEYKKALELQPNNAYAAAQLGGSYVAVGRYQEAEPLLRQALKQQPDDAETLLNLGATMAATGRTDEGLKEIRRSIQIDPSSARAQFALGSILLAQGNHAEAIAPLKEAVRLSPQDKDYQKALAQAESQAAK